LIRGEQYKVDEAGGASLVIVVWLLSLSSSASAPVGNGRSEGVSVRQTSDSSGPVTTSILRGFGKPTINRRLTNSLPTDLSTMAKQPDDASSDSSSSSDSESNEDGSAVVQSSDDDDAEIEESEQTTTNSLPTAPSITANTKMNNNTQAAASFLSKSWAIQTSHVPIYTGGKVVATTMPIRSDSDDDQSTTPRMRRLLVLPVSGDLAIVDAARGRTLTTVRGDNENDDDDDDVDRQGITAYCCSSTTSSKMMIFACSRDLLLKQYEVTCSANDNSSTKKEALEDETIEQKNNTTTTTEATDDIDPTTWSVSLLQSWGKCGHTLPVTQMSLHVSGTFLATGSVDGSVRLWDVRGAFTTHVFRPLATNTHGMPAVTALEWMPSRRQLIVGIGRDDGSVMIHNLHDTTNDQQHVVVLQEHVSAVTCLGWTTDGTLMVTAGRDAVLNLWKLHESSSSSNNKPRMAKNVKAAAAVVVVTTKYERIHTLPIYEQIEGMEILPMNHGVVVATAGSKGVVRLWKIVAGDSATKKQQHLELLAEQPASQAFGEQRGGYLELHKCQVDNTEQLLVADAENNLSFLALLENQPLLTVNRTIVGHNDDILDLKIIPSINNQKQRIVVATNSAKVSIFDLQDFSCQVLDRHTATVLCVDVSPCGRYVATSGKDRQMRVWNLGTNGCVALAVGHTEAVGAVALSRKVGSYELTGKAANNGGGAFVVTASMDRTLKRWNLPGSKELNRRDDGSDPLELQASHSARAHEKDINIVSIAPNDLLIATGSQDKTVKLWKSSDLSLLATLKGHKRGVWDCQFSSYDRVLATSSGDRTVKLWSLSDKYSCVRTFQGHLASVLRIRFLSGGLQFVSSGADGLIKLWTIRTSQCETTLDGHSDKVWAMDLSTSNGTLVSGGGDSKIVVWRDTTKAVEQAEKASAAESIVLDQQLANHLRHKEYSKAFAIALQRDKPHHVLKVLTALVDEEVGKGGSGLESLRREARKWSDDRISQILRYCRDWNTRARNSNIAMLVCKAVVSVFPVSKLVGINGVPEVVAGIIPYSERHFDRLDRLHTSTYLLDFVLASMGGIEASKDVNEFMVWEQTSRLVLPPKTIDGRTQVGGMIMSASQTLASSVADETAEDNEEPLTVGYSDSDSD
jgi:U3 small nucleolar RNA-associated protein 13